MGQLWVKLCRVTVEAYLKPSWMKGNLLKKSLSYIYILYGAALKFLEQLGLNLVIVVHICNPSTWEREVCGSEVEGHPQP